MKLTALCSTFAVISLFTVSASAQGPKTTPAPTQATTTVKTADYTEQKDVAGDQVVKFTGDELAGGNGSPGSSMMIRASGPFRIMLIRPRMNFVPELLKSVENL
jgi:hypothetical protein